MAASDAGNTGDREIVTTRGFNAPRELVFKACGRFGWDGGYGTSWSSDPKEDMVAILMTQRAGFPPLSGVYLDFWTSAYQAIDD